VIPLKPREREVLEYICQFQDRYKNNPGRMAIERKLGYNVEAILRRLKDKGFITSDVVDGQRVLLVNYRP